MSKVFVARGLLLFVLSTGLLSCGSDNQNTQQSREPLRLNLNLSPAYIDDPYNVQLAADGGVRPYRYIMDGNLPKGLSYADGRISGTPQEKGSYELTFTVEDSNLSSRFQKATLTVGDTPPPQLELKYPLAEMDAPFVYAFNIRARESKGFQLQIPLKDLKPTLDSLKANENLLYVLRYDEAKGVVDIDAVFTQPRRDLEAFRMTFTPLEGKKAKPQESFNNGISKIVLFDRKGQMVANSPSIARSASQGKYTYADLQAIARNWGQKVGQQASSPASQPNTDTASKTDATTKDATASANNTQPAAQPATPSTQTATEPTTAQPTTPETQPNPATQPAQPSTEQPATPTQEQPAQTQPQTSTTEPPKEAAPTNTPAPSTETATATETKPEGAATTQTANEAPKDTAPADPAKDAPAAQPQANNPASQATQPAPASPTQPAQGQPTQPVQGQPAQPAQGQPTQPTPAQTPTKTATGLEGDLNGDGAVDQKDLDALRASYAWANVTGNAPQQPNNLPQPQAPTNPQGTPDQNTAPKQDGNKAP